MKRIPRKHVLSILKLKFKPYHLKYGVEVPGAYRYAHARNKGNEYSDKWAKEEQEEREPVHFGSDTEISGGTLSSEESSGVSDTEEFVGIGNFFLPRTSASSSSTAPTARRCWL